MGRFFSNIQIQNNRNENIEQFKKSFCKSMEKKGYISSTKDDSSLTYMLAFSENNKWITLCSANYESGGESVKSDVQFLAESLKTCCISTSVVDSDFSILEMYNSTSSLTDMVVVGDGSGYGFEDDTEFKGKKEAWELLLTENNTWEQLSEIWNGDYVFTEEALSEMALLLGMDSENVLSEYDDLSNRTDENIVELHFKKKGKKALSLNATFIQMFGEVLEPLGFKKIKGKQPYFVRVVEGGEIIHVIAYRNEDPDHVSEKSFNILGGVATVYRNDIDLTIKPYDNKEWLDRNYLLYERLGIDLGDKFKKSIFKFSYKSDSEESMLFEVKRSLDVTKQIMLPFFDKIVDIDACIRYYYTFDPSRLNFMYDVEEFANNPTPYCSESFLLIKTNYRDDGIKRMEHAIARTANLIKEGKCGYSQKDFENECEKRNNFRLQQIAIRDKLLDDPKLNAKVMAMLEQSKTANIEKLKSYGLNI